MPTFLIGPGKRKWMTDLFPSLFSRCAVCQHNGEKHSETAQRYKLDNALDSGERDKISIR